MIPRRYWRRWAVDVVRFRPRPGFPYRGGELWLLHSRRFVALRQVDMWPYTWPPEPARWSVSCGLGYVLVRARRWHLTAYYHDEVRAVNELRYRAGRAWGWWADGGGYALRWAIRRRVRWAIRRRVRRVFAGVRP